MTLRHGHFYRVVNSANSILSMLKEWAVLMSIKLRSLGLHGFHMLHCKGNPQIFQSKSTFYWELYHYTNWNTKTSVFILKSKCFCCISSNVIISGKSLSIALNAWKLLPEDFFIIVWFYILTFMKSCDGKERMWKGIKTEWACLFNTITDLDSFHQSLQPSP